MPPDSWQFLGGLQRVKKNIQKQEYTKMKNKGTRQSRNKPRIEQGKERKKGAPVIFAKGLGKEPHLLAFEIPVG